MKPDGAFYFFVDMKKYLAEMDQTDMELCDHLLKQKGVVAIPGSFFGEKGAGHIRLTFVSEPEQRIDLGMKRIAEYVSSYVFAGGQVTRVSPHASDTVFLMPYCNLYSCLRLV